MSLFSRTKALFRPQGPWDGDREFPGQTHEVGVMDVRPGKRDDFPPYYIAACQCGWTAKARDVVDEGKRAETLEAMKAEARAHSEWLRKKVVRPMN